MVTQHRAATASLRREGVVELLGCCSPEFDWDDAACAWFIYNLEAHCMSAGHDRWDSSSCCRLRAPSG